MTTARPDLAPPTGRRLSWSREASFLPGPGGSAGRPAVVDSWLVARGRVRGLALHEQRFQLACSRLVPGLPRSTVRRFLADVRRELPDEGRWFPRIEAYGGPSPRLALWMRPAPGTGDTVSLWIPQRPDPRTRPGVKGPDLPVLADLRAGARAAGADDALLYAGDGTALEAAHSSIVWWRRDTLCVPAPDLAVLPSVTRVLLEQLAWAWRFRVRAERCSPDELQQVETWTLNALHGIRPVRAWVDSHGRAVEARVSGRAGEWRRALHARALLSHALPAGGKSAAAL
ncbi:aminotransferase class IV [Streptosporangium roseum]|uniref:aminotransferase class IV n=1 Tax=Streptosporangium roseum TaxID=2001 RepID=UPI0009DF2269|nr:aminotransferase class IV [Streptosporangium roseum]